MLAPGSTPVVVLAPALRVLGGIAATTGGVGNWPVRTAMASVCQWQMADSQVYWIFC